MKILGGGANENLIKLYNYSMPIDSYSRFKNYIARVRNRTNQKLEYVLVLQYVGDIPYYELWIKNVTDNSPIDIDNNIFEELWEFGDVVVIHLQGLEIEPLCRYFIPAEHCKLDNFKPYEKLYRTSKGIKRVKISFVDYAEAERKVLGARNVYKDTKEYFDTIEGKTYTFQKVSFQTFVKHKKTLKLSRQVNLKKYKIKVKGGNCK